MAKTHLDLFSGIGIFAYVVQQLGFETKAFAEIDPFCRKVLTKHWPDVYQFERVEDVSAESLGRIGVNSVDLLTAGFPCQPHSYAGSRKASADSRDGWPELRRIIGDIRPRYILLENVAGILSSERGVYFGGLLRDLAQVGYDAEWEVLPASAFGAWHRRERLWLVAYSQCNGYTQPRSQPDAHSDEKRDVSASQSAGWAVCHAVVAGGQDVSHSPSARLPDGAGVSLRRSQPDRESKRRRSTARGVSAVSGAQSLGQQEYGATRFIFTAARQREIQFKRRGYRSRGGIWFAESDMGRTLDGFAAFLDRNRQWLSKAHMLEMGNIINESGNADQTLSVLRESVREEVLQRQARGFVAVSATEVLFAYLCKFQEASKTLLDLPLESAEIQEISLRSLWWNEQIAMPSHRSGLQEQSTGEYSDALQALSRFLAYHSEKAWAAYRWQDAHAILNSWEVGWEDGFSRVVAKNTPRLHRAARIRVLGNSIVPQVAKFVVESILSGDELLDNRP